MHGNLIMMLLAALKSHFFAFFSANSLAISYIASDCMNHNKIEEQTSKT